MTVVASNNPAPDAPASLPAAREPVRLAGIAKPLIVLSRDAQLIAALRKVTDPVHEVLAITAEVELAGALLGHHAGVGVLDCAAFATPAAGVNPDALSPLEEDDFSPPDDKSAMDEVSVFGRES